MVVMALDHVREYFHYAAYFFDPSDPTLTTIPIFFTRFLTNFCAPAFSFLAGLSAYLLGKRKGLDALSDFLFKRGIWLVFVELVIINFGWHFDILFRHIVFQVIWVLGISMIILSRLIYLPKNYGILFSCILIFGHNLLDAVHFEGNILWSFLHELQHHHITPSHAMRVGYAIIPWVAVMSLGYYFGSFYDKTVESARRIKLLNGIGIAAVLLFLILRGTNIYGNLLPWKYYGNLTQTFFSFFDLTKYPPSLCYLLLTLGVALLFLANSEGLKGRIVNFFCVFGRVPFFFYIFHIYLIHFLALLAAGFTGFGWQKMILTALPYKTEELKGFGVNLGSVYLIWIGVIALLYPVCKAYDQYKQRNKGIWWLGYL